MSTWGLAGGFFSVFDTVGAVAVTNADIKTAVDAIKAKTDSLTFTSGKVDANVSAINAIPVTGTGTAADPWGP